MAISDSLLTVPEVAAYLACAEETVKRLARRGVLPATHVAGRLRFARADVEAYSLAHRIPAQERPSSAASYLMRLQLVSGAFSQLQTPSQAAELVVSQCMRALDATTCLLALVCGDVVEIVHEMGYPPGALDVWRRIPLDAATPLTDVLRQGDPLFFERLAAMLEQYPNMSGAPIHNAAWAALPLPIDDRVIGGILLGFNSSHRFSRDDRAFLHALAQQCAQAMERARLHTLEATRRAAAEQAAERTAILQTVTAALSDRPTPEHIAEIVMVRGMQALGAVAGALSLLGDDGTFGIVRMVGYSPDVVARWVGRRYPATLAAPIPDAVRARSPLWIESTDAILARYPHLAAQLTPSQSGAWATLPLIVEERVFGGFTFLFDQPRTFTAEDQSFLLALAQQCAQAIERARLHAAEQRAQAEADVARRQMAILADVSAQLAASLDVQTTLDTLAHLLVPSLADWCVIDMYADDGSIQTIVIAHADPALEALTWEMVRRYPINPDAPGGTAAVLRTRQPELAPEVDEAMLSAVAADAEHLHLLLELGVRSTLCVPLIARGRALGTIALVGAESGRRFSAADLPFVEDLAHRAALAIDNARLYRQSQEAVRIRDTFFSVAAHELKTPLTSLQGQAQLMLRRAKREGGLNPRDLRAVQVIENQATRLNSMILAMLDSVRLEHGRLSIDPQMLDLGVLLRRIVDEIQPTLDRHRLRLNAPAAPVMVFGDAIRLEQVLQNLIGNAVKYSPGGGAVRVLLDQQEQQARIRVEDSGIGIPSAAIPQLFQRFYRAENVQTQHISGMGIGLYVVKEIVALHGGDVAVESCEGRGSCFTVTLPLAPEDRL